MFIPTLLAMVVALFITMLVVQYKKIFATSGVGNLFVGLGDDIIRGSNLSFPRNRLEVPGSVVTKIICRCEDRLSRMLVTTVSNNLYVKSAKARSPTQFNEVGSLMRC